MTRVLHEMERVEWRVLGAVRPVDAATGVPIRGALRVEAPGAVVQRNRSGLHVIRRWSALAAHEHEFLDPPVAPAPGSAALELRLTDPSGTYLPITATIRLPRVPDPPGPLSAESLFRAQDIAMYPSAAAPVGANWAALRTTVTASASGGAPADALGGALVRVRANGRVLARGLTDWRGEALVPVVGVPVTTFSDAPDAVVVTEISVTVEAAFDPARGTRTSAAAVRAGRAPASPPVVDPAALDAAFDTLPRTQLAAAVAARRAQAVALAIDLP